MSKKYKKHTYADRLKYMHMIEDGFSIKSISEQYGIDHILLSSLWATYQSKGRVALEKKCHTEATLEIKIEAIRDFEEKHLSLVNIMTKYGISRAAWGSTHILYKSTNKPLPGNILLGNKSRSAY